MAVTEVLMGLVFWLSVFLLYYIYAGYHHLLLLMAWVNKRSMPFKFEKRLEKRFEKDECHVPFKPKVTIILTVAPGKDAKKGAGIEVGLDAGAESGIATGPALIEARINNLLTSDYPIDHFDIIIAFDGVVDDEALQTLVERVGHPSITQLNFPSAGKTATQNKAVAVATGDIILFTDVNTRFSSDFMTHIVQPFADNKVGVVGGHLEFIELGDHGIPKSQSLYWLYELKLRELESQLGWLAVASGACMAIRRELIPFMDEHIGEDCILPLTAVSQGFYVVHQSTAQAFEINSNNTQSEFRVRQRMTLRNWQGTWQFHGLLNPITQPCTALSLWSHKILRWLSPLFLIMMTMSCFYLASHSIVYLYVSIALLVFYGLGMIGWMAENRCYHVRLCSPVFSFLLANIGFLMGLLHVLGGRKITQYQPS